MRDAPTNSALSLLGPSAAQVTSVKLSPSARYILLGAGVRARYANEAREEAAAAAAAAAAGGGEGQQQHQRGQEQRENGLGLVAPGVDDGVGIMPSSSPPVTSIYRASDLQPVVREREHGGGNVSFNVQMGLAQKYGLVDYSVLFDPIVREWSEHGGSVLRTVTPFFFFVYMFVVSPLLAYCDGRYDLICRGEGKRGEGGGDEFKSCPW